MLLDPICVSVRVTLMEYDQYIMVKKLFLTNYLHEEFKK